jgi:hypothetical protein
LFGEGSDAILRERFVSFVTELQHDPACFDRIRSNERILGPRAFKDLVASSTLLRSATAEVPEIGERSE